MYIITHNNNIITEINYNMQEKLKSDQCGNTVISEKVKI